MGSPPLGLVVDSGVMIAAERRQLSPNEALEEIRGIVGEMPLILSSISVAEIGHGIYRTSDPVTRARRRLFLDDLKATLPIHPITEITAEIMARVSGEQAAKGINLPVADLAIAASALELGFAVGTGNLRDFSRIPGLHVIHL